MSIPERVKTKMKDAGLRAVNKPQRLSDSSSKSHHVMASEGGKYKYIKFGQEGVKTNQTAYNIVRESDLLCAYDFDRCMIYNLYGNNTGNIGAAYNDASNLFQTRVFKHNQDGLFLTKSAQTMSFELEQKSVERMKHWENLLSNGVV